MSKSSRPATLRGFLQIEALHCSSGVAPEGKDVNEQSYLARLIECDARKAEGLNYFSDDIHPLQSIRSSLQRGFLAQAKSQIEVLQQSPIENTSDEATEILLEQARLAAFCGDWPAAIEHSSKAIATGPAAISRTTLLQVRSLSLYESGELKAASRDVESALSLARIYPHGPLAFYIKCMEIKLLAQADLRRAQNVMAATVADLKASPDLNADTVHAILRTELDLQRWQGEPEIDLALACYLIARATGERHYEGLGLLELVSLLPEADREPWRAEIYGFSDEFIRVRELLRELNANEPVTMLAKSIGKARGIGRPMTGELSSKRDCKVVYLIDHGLVVSLSDLSVRLLEIPEQLKKALRVLAAGKISKPEMFERLWGFQFVQERHDAVIRSLLYRLRKHFGVPVESSNGVLCIEHAHVVGGKP